MKLLPTLLLTLALGARAAAAEPNTLTADERAAGWQLLFDGKTLAGWKASEAPGTFTVHDGCLIAFGKRSHLFYQGPVAQHDFRNFEFEAEVMTFPKGNSGVYFHTAYQETGWPSKGYEIQVNNSHTDPKRTAGVYAIQDNFTPPAKDQEWFRLRIVVQGKRIQTFVDGKKVSDYTEEANPSRPASMKGRLIDHGTIAIQGHDPESKVEYRNIKVRVLP